MRKVLIVCDPHYQHGFYGFLKEAENNGCILAIGENKNSFGINIQSNFSKISRFIGRSALWMPSSMQLKSIIVDNNIDWIHVIGEPTYLSVYQCIKAVRDIGAHKITITCRCAQNMVYKMPYFFKYVLRVSREYGVQVYPVSRLSENFAKDFYKLSVVKVLPNGVPESFYETKINCLTRNKITFIGHFIERKGASDFLKLAENNKLFCDYEFVVIGAKKEFCDLDGLRVSYPNIEFIEWVDRSEMMKYIDKSLVVVMPSKKTNGKDLKLYKRIYPIPWSEQFGRVIVEAYSRGVPVVAYDSGAINETIFSTEHLVTEGDVIGLADKLAQVIEENKNVLPRIDLIKYAQEYTWKKVFYAFYKSSKCF